MRAAPRLLLVLCLLAGMAQGVIARTHVHARAVPVPVVGTVGAIGAAVFDAAGREHPLCVLCDIAGHTPAVAPPVSLPAPAAFLARSAPPAFGSASGSARLASHHWHGRAPPIA